MRNAAILVAVSVFFAPLTASAQGGYSRRRSSVATATSGPYTGPAVTFRGTVRAIGKKEITIDLDEAAQNEDHSLTLRRSGKTKFTEGDHEIKASDVKVGAHVAIDATREGDQKLAALNVMIAPLAAKPEEK